MRIANKRKFITTLGMTAILVFLIILLITNALYEPKYTESYKTIYISKGETLWSIAEEYKKPNQDIRDYIHQLEKLNNMDSAYVYEGQALTIIIYEEVR